MAKEKRSLKDTTNDPRVSRKRSSRLKKRNRMVLKLGIALILGFAGGFSTARLVKFL